VTGQAPADEQGEGLTMTPIWGYLLGSANVLTQHGDNARTGGQTHETVLTTSSVRVDGFGKLATRRVDGEIYAQPLYVQGVTINGTAHNVVYVATMKNNVYAFDADDTSANAAPLWSFTVGNPFDMSIDDATFKGCIDVKDSDGKKYVGITGTPVIDPATNSMYLVMKLAQPKNGQPDAAFILFQLDIRTGAYKGFTPISATVQTKSGPVSLNAKLQHQRASLLLTNGLVYVSFGAHCDIELPATSTTTFQPYYGWVLLYDAATLTQRGVFNTTPNALPGQYAGGTNPLHRGGVWQAGQGPAADAAGNVYFMTGNGSFDGETNFGMSVVKLGAGGVTIVDSFTPWNWEALGGQLADEDLGSAGILLVPGMQRTLGGGKSGTLYLLNTTNLGILGNGDTEVPDHYPGATSGHIHGAPVFWSSPAGPRAYVWSERDQLKSFALSTNAIGRAPPHSNVPETTPGPDGAAMPGGFLTVSSNGSASGSGIVWASYPKSDANHALAHGTLYAFNAEDVTAPPLWCSDLRPSDQLDTFAKFVPPTVANGKVYQAAWATSDPNGWYGRLVVYGPKSTPGDTCAGHMCTTISACGMSIYCPPPAGLACIRILQ
jgi:hypothetical protein